MEIKATGTKDTRKLLDVLINAGAPGKGASMAALLQLVENAVDAGASVIEITIDRRSRTFSVMDDGEGFGQKQIDGFHSLYVSPKAGLKGLIGKWGSGRVFCHLIAEKIEVFSHSSEYKGTANFSLTREDLEELLKSDKIERPIAIGKRPRFMPKHMTTAVVLREVAWSHVPTPGEVQKRLASHLRPSVARIVRVNGNPLESREVVGEVIHEVITVDYLPEQQEIELFVPISRVRSDEVRLGGYNPICSMRDVHQQLPSAMGAMVPPDLLNGVVCGIIIVPAVNEYRGHDGRSLEDRFYRSGLLPQVLRFFQEEVATRIEAAFKKKKEEDEEKARRRFLSKICESINQAWDTPLPDDESSSDDVGDDEEGDTVPSLEVNCKRVELLPGERMEFKVIRTRGTSNSFIWDAMNAGGKLSHHYKREVVYIAGGAVGAYELIVRDRKNAAIFAKIQIKILVEKELKIVPGLVDIVAGEEQVFRLRNFQYTSGKIVWEVTPEGALELVPEPHKALIRTNDRTQGLFTLIAYDAEKPEDIWAEAMFEVKPAPMEEEPILRLEDTRYLLEESTMPLPALVECDIERARFDVHGKSGQRLSVMLIDLNHEFFKSIGKLTRGHEARIQILLPHLIAAHLEARVRQGLDELDEISFRMRLAGIHTRVLCKRVEECSLGGDGEGEEEVSS